MKPQVTLFARLLCLLLVGMLFSACRSVVGLSAAQTPIPKDEKGEALFTLGENYFKARNYTDAAQSFEAAGRRPPFSLTTAALYMAGLAHYRNREPDLALERFQSLLKNYPATSYADQVNYHKALILLGDNEKRDGGLYVLLNLLEHTPDKSLQADALQVLNRFLYGQADLAFLESYYDKCRASFKPQVLEAVLYALKNQGRTQEIADYLVKYQASGGQLTPHMRALAGGTKGKGKQLRIALMLPFFSQYSDSTLNPQSLVALELMEGMRIALDEGKYAALSDVELRVYDTRSDSAHTEELLNGQVKAYHPHIIIGDVKNRPSRSIAAMAEAENILHIVPLSDSPDLIDSGDPIFLANPSTKTTALTMLHYLQEQKKVRVLIITDGTHTSEASYQNFANSRTAGADSPKMVTVHRTISPNALKAVQQLTSIMQDMRTENYDALYLPVANEQLVSFAFHELQQDSIDVQVLGNDSWRGYRSLDRDALSHFSTVITDSYYPGNDSAGMEDFQAQYMKAYRLPASAYAIQGYDIARYLLSTLADAWPTDLTGDQLAKLLHKAKPFKGLAQNFYYAGANDDQSVQLLRYADGEIQRVTPWKH